MTRWPWDQKDHTGGHSATDGSPWPGLHPPPLLSAAQGPARAGVQEQTTADKRVVTAKPHPPRQTVASRTRGGCVAIHTHATVARTWKLCWARSVCLGDRVGAPAGPGAGAAVRCHLGPAATAPSWVAPGHWPRQAGRSSVRAARSSSPRGAAAAASSCGSSRG